MSTLKVGTIQNTSGVEVYTCKAWVNFNGTGTVAIRASGNVSSITDNATGDYTVNFTTAMPDANYCAVVNGVWAFSTTAITYNTSTTYSTTQCQLICTNTGAGSNFDPSRMCVSIFR